MRFRVLLAAVCVTFAFFSSDARADVSSTQQILSEIRLWDNPGAPACAKLVGQGYDVIPDLLAIADNPNNKPVERSNALRVLGMIARRHRSDSPSARAYLQRALPILVKCMNSLEDGVFAGFAAQDIGYIGDFGKPAIPDLIKATKSPFQPVRACAISSLGMFGAEAQEALPALKAALNDADLSVRTVAADAILKVSPRQEQTPSPL